MQIFGIQSGPRAFGWGPMALGLLLIWVGILLFIWPQLLAFVVAAVFIAAGVSLIATGWTLRRHVSYRRLDE